jgi:3-oxoacyl-[acyl-carrier-protein] synthase-1
LQQLALSHFCIVTSLGAGRAATVAALRDGASGLRPCAFDQVSFPTFVGEVSGIEGGGASEDLGAFDCRNNRLAAFTLTQDGFGEAVASARRRYGADRLGVFVGTSTSGILETEGAYRRRDPVSGALPSDFDYTHTHSTYSLGRLVRTRLGLSGPAAVVSAACSATAKVFATASRMIAAGFCDAAVVGGADTLCGTTLYGFNSLQLLSDEPCRPFDVDRKGISIGEAAGFALLERPEACDSNDGVLVTGIGESSDAYHMSSPHPEGLGARIAMERALSAAGLAPDDIDHVNLHGTATPVGDAAEDRAVSELFGESVLCSSTKGYTGHTLGASGIVEAIISALSILHEFLPGSPHTRRVDPNFRTRYSVEPLDRRIDRVMSNSFGFGGSNCSLVLARP